MKVLIIEDEKLSAEHIASMLKKLDANIQVVAILDSVKKSIEWFQQKQQTDLIFLDIHLADGISFEIFSHVLVDIPIIFTTAYNEYALKAFQLNSVDYLLKPIAKDDLQRAYEKFKKFHIQTTPMLLENISNAYQNLSKQYKTRFLVKSGQSIDSIKSEAASYFITLESITFLVLENGKRYPIDYTLDQLEELINPLDFFRINRKVIINIKSIQKVSVYFNSRLHIEVKNLDTESSIVSRERVSDFKDWLDK